MVLAMDDELTIQQVAELTQLSSHTLRYYERIGLLAPVDRAPNGHRRYSRQDIAWIEFLTRLRATGMPIRQMQQFATLRREGDETIARRRMLLETHQQTVQQQIDELSQNLSIIQAKIQHYKALELHHDTNSGDHALRSRLAKTSRSRR
jgi:DNA-binding transcriptional MerR regulator